MKDKQALFDSGLYLIAMSDEGLETKKLKQAIKELKQLIYVRENVPF